MKTRELLESVPGLSRSQLYFWEKKQWIRPHHFKRGTKMNGRDYSPGDVAKVKLLFKSYGEGYKPDDAYKRACGLKFWTNPQLRGLLDASQTIIKTTFRGDRTATLSTVADTVRRFSSAESCAIFLVDETKRDELYLQARADNRESLDDQSCRLKIHSVGRGGLTGHLAHQGESVSLDWSSLEHHPNIAAHRSPHLVSGKCFSVLCVPLKDRKGDLLGLLKLENKQDASGNATPAAAFDDIDKTVAEVLAHELVLGLESLRRFETFQLLLKTMNAASGLRPFLNELLRHGLALIQADRGDIAWWNEERRDLIMEAQWRQSTMAVGQSIPEPSVTRTVFRTGQPLILPDVTTIDYYWPCHEATRSEVAVPLFLDGDAVGVLNAESFKADAFDDQDIQILEHLAEYGALAAKMVASREVIYREMLPPWPSPSASRDEILARILESVRREIGFDAGLIYIADYSKGQLRALAAIGCEDMLGRRDVCYGFSDVSLAAEVFRRRAPYFSDTPHRDPKVSRSGLAQFDIRGPVLGVPLMFGSIVIGVLVVWSRRNRKPANEDARLLTPYAKLAVTTIGISETESQRADALQEILSLLQQNAPLREILRVILGGILASGFDRARVFGLSRDPLRFVCLDSIGVERDGRFSGVEIRVSQSPYAQYTSNHWRDSPVAAIRFPSMFGTDPSAPKLCKPEDLPWAIVPLVIAGELFGYIAADNALSRREITPASLNYMSLIGALAAQAIANARHGSAGGRAQARRLRSPRAPRRDDPAGPTQPSRAQGPPRARRKPRARALEDRQR